LEKTKQKEKAEKTEPVTQIDTKLNKYGFMHIKKRQSNTCPSRGETQLIGRIEDNQLIIEAKK
jgi:hypothetical protein